MELSKSLEEPEEVAEEKTEEKTEEETPTVDPVVNPTTSDIINMSVGLMDIDLAYDLDGDGEITSRDALLFEQDPEGMAAQVESNREAIDAQDSDELINGDGSLLEGDDFSVDVGEDIIPQVDASDWVWLDVIQQADFALGKDIKLSDGTTINNKTHKQTGTPGFAGGINVAPIKVVDPENTGT
ncbi:hypothetical protein N9Y98_03480, partial [Candidatus Pelagibacter bacterium]|nr:hypothetical protein [Candidatus Pelagibacter bacterium]